MSRTWPGVLLLAVVAPGVAAGATACRGVLGLHDPIVADDAGGDDGAAGGDVPPASDAADAGPGADVDNGAVSTTYPAFRPTVPQLVLVHSGAFVPSPVVRVVAFAGDPLADSITAGAAAWLPSTVWTAQTDQYGIDHGSVAPLVTFAETPPATLTAADVRAWLAAKLDGSHPELGPVDDKSLAADVFVVLYPSGTAITTPAGASCQAFTGYHDDVVVGTARTAAVVLPRCDSKGIALSTAGSYGLLAAVTNPRPSYPGYASFDPDHVAWNFLHGDGASELPQPCAGEVVYLNGRGLPLARSWSNAAVAQYHDPCQPVTDALAYFASVPVMSDSVWPPGGYPTQGIRIAAGQSRTVEVQLWSDGPTGGPWKVDASVLPGFPAGALSFAFDRVFGQNGEKLHLTITANGDASVPFALTSTLGTKQTTWVGLVGP